MKIIIVINVLIFSFICLFNLSNFVFAKESQIFINEVCWMGTTLSSSDEWIELYNNTDNEIDLEGWTLESKDGKFKISLTGVVFPNGYFLLERTDDDSVPGKEADLIYSGSLSNSGEFLELKNSDEVVVDLVDASAGWQSGDNETKQTMERNFNGLWITSNLVGGTPKTENASSNSDDDIRSNQEVNSGNESILQHYQLGIIVINELVSDPIEGEKEWIELYSNSNVNIDLSGWSLVEGSGSKTLLDGSIRPSGFYVVQAPKGNLNNSGDIVQLQDLEGQIIDQVAYGNWDDGYVENNAQEANDPNSLARINDGYDTGNDKKDFSISEPTKGFENAIKKNNIVIEKKFGNIVFSEIFPNPFGDDSSEFIEIQNLENEKISLLGSYIQDKSGKRFTFTEDFCELQFNNNCDLGVKEFLVLGREFTGIYLNNSNEKLDLYSKNDEKFDSVGYQVSNENESYVNTPFGWLWTKTVTPGSENSYEKINVPPVVDFSYSGNYQLGVPVMFDASDTYDEDDKKLSYYWDFGDGFTNELVVPEHTYFKPGIYKVSLDVSDGVNTTNLKKEIVIKGFIKEEAKEAPINFGETKIFITEIVPNPDGDDEEGEYIEIYNASDEKVNLIDWVIDDIDGGSRPYRVENEIEIEPNGYYVFNRTDTGVVLNNNFDEVRLISPNNKTVESVKYEKAKSGYSFTKLSNGEWTWTEEFSPENENVIVEGVSLDNINPEVESSDEYFINVDLKNIKDFKSKDKIRTRGIVAVLPGVLSEQYFYIVGSPGLQVYSYKKDFPALTVGDYIEVEGELSEINGEKRIKTDTRFAISFLQEEKRLIPQKFQDIVDDSVASFIQFKGVARDVNKDSLVVSDGEKECEIKIKENVDIKMDSINEGDEIEVSGIYCGGNNPKVYPRSQGDLIVLNSNNKVIKEDLVQKNDEWNLPQRDNNFRKYFYLFSVLIVAFFGIFYFRRKVS